MSTHVLAQSQLRSSLFPQKHLARPNTQWSLALLPAAQRQVLYSAGFFLTSAAEKTKTQGQNSSKKLKEKTQPLGATLLKFVKTQEKNSSFGQISRGTPKYAIFITKYFQKREDFGNCFNFLKKKSRKKHFVRLKFPKTQGKNLKTQGKNPKLKEKTQALGVLILALAPNWC